MKKHLFTLAFALGLLAVVWVAATALGGHPLVLLMTMVIGAVFVAGAGELRQFRQHTQALAEAVQATAGLPAELTDLGEWLHRVPDGLRQTVRQRVEGERVALPGPALTPYLVGLLVMLGMLGTFLGMLSTLNGAAFALQGVSDIQGIRSAFSEPIKGLGLAFGASVAGVATSAMLGLMSTLVRRERLLVAQSLDQAVATQLRGFSLAHQRQGAYRALQQQSQTLPAVAAQLGQLMAQMAHMQQQLGDRLMEQQERFHREARETTQALAQSVDQSLRHSLTHSMHIAGESLRPMVQATMDRLEQQAQTVQTHLAQSTEQHIAALAERFGQTSAQVAERWQSALAQHERSSQDTTARMGQTLDAFAHTFESKAQAVLTSIEHTQASREAQLGSWQTEQLQAWQHALHTTQAQLQQGWQQSWQDSHAQQQVQQQHLGEALAHTARELGNQLQTQTAQSLAGVQTLVQSAEALMHQRIEAEAQWLAQHQQRSAALTEQWRSELGALRSDEAQRGQAAIERLGQLEAAVADHLTRLGAALEAPLARLIETATEAPKAAAEVIAQLRGQISASVAHDNALLQERTRTLETLNELLTSIRQSGSEQREVIDSLVGRSHDILAQAGAQFGAQMGEESGKLAALASEVRASAIEVASLGESFGLAARTLHGSHEKMLAQLQQIEGALAKSMARSDEQLAYYVAQAREVIDLSLSSQKDVLDALSRASAKPALRTAAAQESA
ncbi:MAG: DUF802 domain-containing protein [Betaproteobacteria bacterium]|nr:DUF802 domain-containing protein [Betaproteobacteria bacterium]